MGARMWCVEGQGGEGGGDAGRGTPVADDEGGFVLLCCSAVGQIFSSKKKKSPLSAVCRRTDGWSLVPIPYWSTGTEGTDTRWRGVRCELRRLVMYRYPAIQTCPLRWGTQTGALAPLPQGWSEVACPDREPNPPRTRLLQVPEQLPIQAPNKVHLEQERLLQLPPIPFAQSRFSHRFFQPSIKRDFEISCR